MNKRFLITGGAGFIGSHLAKHLLNKIYEQVELVVIVDNLYYAGNLENIQSIREDPRLKFFQIDINDHKSLVKILKKYDIETIFHLAAFTHVDHSISEPEQFVNNNILGSFGLIAAVKDFYQDLPYVKQTNFKFVNLSTDEVYGDYANSVLPALENADYNPSSPYSASKAATDMLLNAYRLTYQLPILTLVMCNNFGSYQFPEKLIPLTILHLLSGKEMHVYGDGEQMRQWIYVKDAVQLIYNFTARWNHEDHHKYNISGESLTNNQVVTEIANQLEAIYPIATNKFNSKKSLESYHDLITYSPDRPAHDKRYWTQDFLMATTGIKLPKHNFKVNIVQTIQWYLQHYQDQILQLREFDYEEQVSTEREKNTNHLKHSNRDSKHNYF